MKCTICNTETGERVKHYFRAGREFLEDTRTGEIVSKSEGAHNPEPEDLFLWCDLWGRFSEQEQRKN